MVLLCPLNMNTARPHSWNEKEQKSQTGNKIFLPIHELLVLKGTMVTPHVSSCVGFKPTMF